MAPFAGVKIRLNPEGVRQVLLSQQLERDLVARANRMKATLPVDKGEEWEVVVLRGDRVSVLVKAANLEARQRAAEDPVLQQSLEAGR